MKKMLFFAVAAVAFASCGSKQAAEDVVAEEEVAVEEVVEAADSVVAEADSVVAEVVDSVVAE